MFSRYVQHFNLYPQYPDTLAHMISYSNTALLTTSLFSFSSTRSWRTPRVYTGSGCSVRSGRSSPDATSCRTQRWRFSWPTGVSEVPLSVFYIFLPFSIIKLSLSLFGSVGHVQLPRPGHSKESGPQSPSSRSGHQLRTSTSQVGQRIPKESEKN